MDSKQSHLPSGIKAILLMGGCGERFGSSTPKQFHPLAGKKVYLHTVEIFLSSQLFDEIILVVSKTWLKVVKDDLSAYLGTPLTVVEGGLTRQESSLKGLLSCDPHTRVAVIHDAVRPFISHSTLKDNVEKALQFHAVDTCIPSTDTLVYAPVPTLIEQIPIRSHYLRGQTPQSFNYKLILAAHQHAEKTGWKNQSDDCSLVLNYGHPVHIVQGSEENIKITSELDLFLAEQLLRLKHTSCPLDKQQVSLQGKRIAVTGGMGGIGSQICQLLEKEGAIPLIISRSAPTYKADLCSSQETKNLFDLLSTRYGPLDGLINSIGYLKTNPLETLSEEEIRNHITTNLTSIIYCCKYVKLKKGGHIINIASSSYIRGKKNYTVYSSTKAALINFTQGLSEERKELFINALVPQRTDTPLRLSNFPGEDPATLLNPIEVAQAAIRLLKQRSLTGSTVEVRQK